MKKTIVILAAVASACFGETAFGETVEVWNWAQLKENLEAGNSVKLIASFDQGQADQPISLEKTGANVTLDLDGHSVKVLLGYFISFGNTGKNITFTLTDATGVGSINSMIDQESVQTYGNTTGCVLVGSGGTFVMENGTICGFRSIGYYGIILVEGAFHMSGGNISNARAMGDGGAVSVINGGSFMMSGGLIDRCFADKEDPELGTNLGGGVYVGSSGTFTMTGGDINMCGADQGGGVAVASGGTFGFSGGEISRNSAADWGGGVYLLSNSTMSFSGGEISNNQAYREYLDGGMGGGIASSGKLTMTGGKMTGNKVGHAELPIAIHSNLDDGDAIYGGVINGAVMRDGDSKTLSVYGGVFDSDQTDNLASGQQCVPRGERYLVGRDILLDSNSKLKGGMYTFCPTNAEYVAAGVAVAPNVVVGEKAQAKPPTWMLITRPAYLDTYGPAVTEKFDAWAMTFGSCDPDGVYTNAFLLNVATNREVEAVAAFKIGSITVTNEVVDVELAQPLPPATMFNGTTWLQCATNGLDEADFLDIEEGRYTEEGKAVFVQRIDFEHTLTPEAFPTEAEGSKTMRVIAK